MALVGAVRKFPSKQGRRVTFEYVLLRGVNDSDEDASRLAALLQGLPVKVNLIPYNPTGMFEGSSRKAVAAFRAAMDAGGATYTFEAFPGVVHSFTVPDADKANNPGMKYDKKADEKTMQQLADRLSALRAVRIAAYPAKDLKAFGLDALRLKRGELALVLDGLRCHQLADPVAQATLGHAEAEAMAALGLEEKGAVVVTASEGWHPGIVGLVAARGGEVSGGYRMADPGGGPAGRQAFRREGGERARCAGACRDTICDRSVTLVSCSARVPCEKPKVTWETPRDAFTPGA